MSARNKIKVSLKPGGSVSVKERDAVERDDMVEGSDGDGPPAAVLSGELGSLGALAGAAGVPFPSSYPYTPVPSVPSGSSGSGGPAGSPPPVLNVANLNSLLSAMPGVPQPSGSISLLFSPSLPAPLIPH